MQYRSCTETSKINKGVWNSDPVYSCHHCNLPVRALVLAFLLLWGPFSAQIWMVYSMPGFRFNKVMMLFSLPTSVSRVSPSAEVYLTMYLSMGAWTLFHETVAVSSVTRSVTTLVGLSIPENSILKCRIRKVHINSTTTILLTAWETEISSRFLL